MASTADFRNGLVIEFNNDLFTIVSFRHVKPGGGRLLKNQVKKY